MGKNQNYMKKTKLISASLLALFAVLAGINQGVAQSTAFTYQGQIIDNGVPFTGVGQFQFALQVVTNTSSQAIVGVGVLSGINSGAIESCVVYYGGYGYVTPPTVTFSGGNPDATGTAVVNNGVVTGINITSGGYYPAEVFVSVAPPPNVYTNFTIWNNDGTSGSEPVSAVSVGVTNGLFTVQLGDPTLPNMTPIPASIFLQTNLLLQIWFNDGLDGWAALNPAQPLTATPYATFANTAGTLTGTLPTSQLTGSVPTSQLSGSVPAASLSGSVPSASLTSVPAASLTGAIPASSLTSVPAASLTGAVPASSLTSVPAGSLTGSVPSASLTSVPAGSLTGTVADGRLSANVALRAGGNAFTGNQIITSGYLGIGLTNPTYPLEVASNGVPKMTLDYAGNLECSGTIYSKGQALTSDRNLKENFQPVNNRAVLAKIAALPLTRWNYKSDSQAVQHLGPMAQDFSAAFGLDGMDDKHISVVDEGGVALAAIQGLDQEVKDKAATILTQGAEIQSLKQQNEALAAQLQQLATAVKALAEKR